MSYNSIYRRDLFRDHIVVITGGGSGIGRCTAHELASLGAHVAIVGRNEVKLERVRCEIASDGGSISTHVADIRDEHAVIAMVERVLADHGHIDGLVNNAGGLLHRVPRSSSLVTRRRVSPVAPASPRRRTRRLGPVWDHVHRLDHVVHAERTHAGTRPSPDSRICIHYRPQLISEAARW